ncbi:alpha/beta hydrolase [Lacticaseibacillus brantae]|uniref:Cell surface hydrolase n=1 Tax=Lacticaseibacillus brantae DSM 23927 TaxID=1423727 RepID=A0A0R2B609_9LACO|nr:alpha/beta hydrolase [Lacticaseibacillus brantae]KRM71494.1 cell surface hydrolase [Lacticaseibacillus brantae DSM 23927]
MIVKHWQWLAIVVFIGLLCGIPASQNLHASRTPPTIFVHGLHGNATSMADLIRTATEAGRATKTLTVTVRPNGGIVLSDETTSDLPAMIQVIFENNHAGERQDTIWLRNIYRKLYQTYGYSQINAVGHSMGAYAVIGAAMLTQPIQINKILAIAGPYNGILHWNDAVHETTLDANGKPSLIRPEYQWLLSHAHRFKASRVLNVYGDVADGSSSDTVVTTNSALALGYVLRHSPTHYQTQLVSGPHAQHSLLHSHNRAVDQVMLSYLFD